MRPARTGEDRIVGVVLAGSGQVDLHAQFDVIVDDDAVYAVDDVIARAIGEQLDVAGRSGAQRVSDSLNGDLEVVIDSLIEGETLVRISCVRHATPVGPSGARRAASCSGGDQLRLRLTPDTERLLVVNAAAGDREARTALVESYLPAISGVARIYRHAHLEHADLMQEGVVGLLRAIGRFDPERGVPFWAYASWWVRQAMQQLVSELTRPAVLSDRAMRALARIKRTHRELTQTHAREPTLAELVTATKLPREQVANLLSLDRAPRGLEEHVGGASTGGTWGDLLPDPAAEDDFDNVIEHLEIERVRPLVEQLGEREREIIYERYGLGRPAKTLRAIGVERGLSAERVRQIEVAALERLRVAAASPAPACIGAPASPDMG